jgi:Uma2 family endonuclease
MMTTAAMEPGDFLLTAGQYYKMAEVGLFEGKRVELIEGRIIERSPAGSKPATAITLASDCLREAFSKNYFIRVQCSIDFNQCSVPEPDIAIIKGNVRDFSKAHPTTAALIVEIADTTLHFDRREKASLYARAGIKDYWVINLLDKRLEVYRKPIKDASQALGFSYSEIRILTQTDSVKPLAAKVEIAVADLLP